MAKTLEEKIAIMQAAAKGASIEAQSLLLPRGWEFIDAPAWNWNSYDYRVVAHKKIVWIAEYWNVSKTDTYLGTELFDSKEALEKEVGKDFLFSRAIKFVEEKQQ